jgi:xanthine/CO dehydrogenase XdhC/CoxF family maturation factor
MPWNETDRVSERLNLIQAVSAEPDTTFVELCRRYGVTASGGRMTVFLEKHAAAPSLVVFGAGHVARELAALSVATGLRVTISASSAREGRRSASGSAFGPVGSRRAARVPDGRRRREALTSPAQRRVGVPTLLS